MKPGSLSELKSRIDVHEFLEELGIRNISKRGVEYDYSCPFEGHKRDDKTPSASMRGDTTAFKCWGCGRSGDAISFLATHENVSPMQAAQWLRARFGTGFMEPSGGAVRALEDYIKPKKGEKFTWSAIEPTWWEIEWFEPWYMLNASSKEAGDVPGWASYMLLDRGFNPETLNRWEVGFSPEDDMIVLPLRNPDGTLIGVKGRAWKEDQRPRYKVIGGPKHGFDPAPVGRIVFGSHLSHGGKIILREGELNTIMLDQYGYRAIGISGHSLTQTQADIICSRYDECLIWFDDDGVEEAAALLAARMPVEVLTSEEDPCDLRADEVAKVLKEARPYMRTLIESKLAR